MRPDTASKKIAFWDRKLLPWDFARYDRLVTLNNPVNNRLKEVIKLIEFEANKKIFLDLGCGTGRLIEPLFKCGIENYIGVDFSKNAIEAAQERAAQLGVSARCKFYVQSASEPISERVDCVISLGLLDWLTDAEITTLISNYSGVPYVHSFSLKSYSMDVWLHQLFIYLTYGFRSDGYIPRYFKRSEMNLFFSENVSNSVRFYQPKNTSFSTFILNLPL